MNTHRPGQRRVSTTKAVGSQSKGKAKAKALPSPQSIHPESPPVIPADSLSSPPWEGFLGTLSPVLHMLEAHDPLLPGMFLPLDLLYL